MRQINLLPKEIAERRRAREITLMLGFMGLALLAILVMVFFIQQARLGGERGRLEDAERQNAALQRRVNGLQQFARSQQTLRNKEQLLVRLTQNEVRWSVLLNDVAVAIPSDVWLTNFSGSVQVPSGQARPTAAGPIPLGTVTVTGSTFTHLDVARWLARLAGVREFVFPYLSLSSKSGDGTEEIVQFNSSFQLSDAALRRNQPGGERRP